MNRYRLLIIALLFGLLPVASNAETFTARVIDFRDDAEEDITGPTAGDVRRSSSDLEIGNENLVEQFVGLRFQDVTIPAGSTINSATVQFTGTSTDVGRLTVPIQGQLSPDTVEFGDLTPISGRPFTNSSVAWEIDPWVLPNDVFGPNTTTPNLAAVVQEIVDQDLWEAGNSMVFVFQNQPMDTSERIATSFDSDPNAAPILVIDFTPPTDPVDPTPVLLGDVNLDSAVNFLDIAPFVARLTTNTFQAEADIDQNEIVNFLDIAPFVGLLSGQ